MLHIIRSINDPYIELLKDDPVRPEIPAEFRVGDFAEVLVSLDADNTPTAVVCVSYQHEIPSNVEELYSDQHDPLAAIFYTIWSYAPGAGAAMIFLARDHVLETRPSVKRFVTLSPVTDMARRFHLRNGAKIFRTNENSVNYEYK